MNRDNIRRTFRRIAAPMILSNISVALLGLVDTAVIGHLDSAYYLGAVALGAVVFDFLYWGAGFIRMGTTGVAAQAYGKDDVRQIPVILAQSVLMALGIGMVIWLFQRPVIELGIFIVNGSPQVEEHARTYCRVMMWGAPAVMTMFAVSGWLLGLQKIAATVYIVVFINVLNIILDVVFVLLLNMEVRGVALASVIAQYAGVMLSLFIVARELEKHAAPWSLRRIFEAPGLRKFVRLNHDIFIRTVCLIVVFAFFTREGARQGDVILAANAILMKFYLLMALSLDGFAHAAETMVGSAIGREDRSRLIATLRLVFAWSAGFALVYSIFYALGGAWLIDLLTDLDAVRQAAYEYLPWMILSPLVAVWCFALDGIFIGATRASEMRNSMLVCAFVIFFPCWFVFSPLGNHGLWLAFTVFLVARGISLLLIFIRIEQKQGFINARY